MKLTVPAIRAAEPNARRQEVAQQTSVLLDAIDTLLAELAGPSSHGAKTGSRASIRGTRELATCALIDASARPAHHSASPVPPAAA
jgi:hypothetical protein